MLVLTFSTLPVLQQLQGWAGGHEGMKVNEEDKVKLEPAFMDFNWVAMRDAVNFSFSENFQEHAK